MMRRLPATMIVLALCALPARGADPPSSVELHALTTIDAAPTMAELIDIAGPDPVGRLRDLSLSSTTDFGVRLRAIRALPQFCNTIPSCKDAGDLAPHPARLAVLDILAGISPTDSDGKSILRLRAAIEALGAVKSGQQSDVDRLLPFLDHQNRDIRTTTARALRDLCLGTAVTPLRTRYEQESIAQVRLAISAALGDLQQCSQ